MNPDSVPPWTAHALEVVCRAIAETEPDLPGDVIKNAVVSVAPSRAKQRNVAEGLYSNPGLLTAGVLAGGSPLLVPLIAALQQAGARHVVAPRCGRCGRSGTRLGEIRDQVRICGSCANSARIPKGVCPGCGQTRLLKNRDFEGRAVCHRCLPRAEAGVPLTRICDAVRLLEPALEASVLKQTIGRAVPHAHQQLALAEEIAANPALLTGAGATGSSRLIALLEAVAGLGARTVVLPPCPVCGRARRLPCVLLNQRVCVQCYQRARAETCCRCGALAHVKMRTSGGQPLCVLCVYHDPQTHEVCDGCGRRRAIERQGGGRRLCSSCNRPPIARCLLCGKIKRCYQVSEGAARCATCSVRRAPCCACGQRRIVRIVGPHGPLCQRCYGKDPVSLRTCVGCGAVRRPYHFGECADCVLRRRLEAFFKPAASRFAALRDRLENGADARRTIAWLDHTETAKLLARVVGGTVEPTHRALDAVESPRAARDVRALLVTCGLLAARKFRVRDTTEAVIAAITGTLQQPRSLLLGLYDARGRLHYVGSSTGLTAAAARSLAGALTAADQQHPWRGQVLAQYREVWRSEGLSRVSREVAAGGRGSL